MEDLFEQFKSGVWESWMGNGGFYLCNDPNYKIEQRGNLVNGRMD